MDMNQKVYKQALIGCDGFQKQMRTMLDRCCMGLWIWEKMERSKKNVQTTLYTIIEELIRVF